MIYYGKLGSKIQRDFNSATRFHILSAYPYSMNMAYTGSADNLRFQTDELTLQNGDRLRVFNSISDGHVLWEGKLDFQGQTPRTAAPPKGLGQKGWKALFGSALPAKLTKIDSGETIEGILQDGVNHPGDSLVLRDFHNNAYDSLHGFEQGDTLQIFSGVTDGNIVWEGDVKTLRSPVTLFNSRASIQTNSETGPITEHVGNGLIQPNIKDVRQWVRELPAVLERNHC